MSKKIIYTDKSPEPIGPYSQAVKAGGMIYISGQIPLDPHTGDLVTDTIENETQQVLKNIEAILVEAGSEFSKVVKSSIFLSDMNNFSKVNEVYGRYFTENPPARETVEVSRLPKDVNVEISIIAME